MVKKLLVIVILIFATAVFAEDQLLFSADFTNPPDPARFEIKDPKYNAVKNGLFEMNAFPTGHVHAYLRQTFDSPIRISFKLRFIAAADKSDKHFGIVFTGGNNNMHRFFTRGTSQFYTQNRENGVFHPDSAHGNITFKHGYDTPYLNVRLDLLPKRIQVTVNNQSIYNLPNTLIPLQVADFYAYNCHVQLDDLQVHKLDINIGKDFVQEPVFKANFENSLNASAHDGSTIEPLKQTNTSFVNGPVGKAIQLDDDKTNIEYDAKKLFSTDGAILFWAAQNHDGSNYAQPPDWTLHSFLNAIGDDGKTKLNFWFTWHWLRGEVGRKNNQSSVACQRLGRSFIKKDDWNHYAMTWNNEGKIQLLLNGLPYLPANNFFKNMLYTSDLDLESITKIIIPAKKNQGLAIDEIKVFRRPVSIKEINEEYRKGMPIDLALPRSILDADKDEAIILLLAPGGELRRPNPAPMPLVKAKVTLELTLLDEENNIVAQNSIQYNVDKTIDAELKVGKLPQGNYRLVAKVNTQNGTVQRSFNITSTTLPKPQQPSNENLAIGKLVFEKHFTNPEDESLLKVGRLHLDKENKYIEVGFHKYDRLAIQIDFPKDHPKTKPVLLEIEWPDDKPRMIGLYMYPKSKTKHHRDRLQGGIQAGNEYPNSGQSVKTQYLFYPQTDSYLFETRTMATGFPAAISAFRIYQIDKPLPKLNINYPDGLEGRKLGHHDEDQTPTTSLPENEKGINGTVHYTNHILDYFDYTGQNTIYYPLLRYSFTYAPLDCFPGNGMLPFGVGENSYMIDAFNARHKQFYALINFTNLPEIANADLIEHDYAENGLISLDKDGNQAKAFAAGAKLANLACPEARKCYVKHVQSIAETDGKRPGFQGFIMNSFYSWKNLNQGYDNYTVDLFQEETGVKLTTQNPFEELTTTHRNAWIKWRADVITKLVREVRAMLDQVNPNLKLLVNVSYTSTPKKLYEEHGIDLATLQTIENVAIVPVRKPTSYRHAIHWGSPESNIDELLYDQASAKNFARKSLEAAIVDTQYYESFMPSLKNDVYASYFQNADVKPHGRFFLKDLAFCVAAGDAQEITYGAQPLGSWGRDQEMREFAQAYCALPKGYFEDVPGAQDPIAVRKLNTKNGIYFYAVNMIFTDLSVKLTLKPNTRYLDLATNQTNSDDTIHLKPFQLRSFRIISGDIGGASTIHNNDATQFYTQRLNTAQNALDILKAEKLNSQQEIDYVQNLNQAIQDKRYAEAHRIAFAPTINQMLKKLNELNLLKKQKELIDNNTFYINCGSTAFYDAPNGKLYFPDKKFDGTYGYFGQYKCVARDIDPLKNNSEPNLFANEAYDIDGYKVKLPNGSYNITLHMKVGYPNDFKKDNVVLNIFAQGKAIAQKFDLHQQQKEDFWTTIKLTANNVEVTDNILTISFEAHDKRPTNFRLCNGIEITPNN